MRDIESRSASPPRQKNGGAPGKPGKGARNYQAGWMPFASEPRAPALRATGESPSRGARAPSLFRASVVFVALTASLSVSPEIVAAREDFFNHGWTRINTDEDGVSLIRVHPWLDRIALRTALPARDREGRGCQAIEAMRSAARLLVHKVPGAFSGGRIGQWLPISQVAAGLEAIIDVNVEIQGEGFDENGLRWREARPAGACCDPQVGARNAIVTDEHGGARVRRIDLESVAGNAHGRVRAR